MHLGKLGAGGVEGVPVQRLVEGQDVGGKGLEGGGPFLFLDLGLEVICGLAQGIFRDHEPCWRARLKAAVA